jgi:hypothetical protein
VRERDLQHQLLKVSPQLVLASLARLSSASESYRNL